MRSRDQVTSRPAPGAPPSQGEPRYPWRAFALTLALIAVLAGGLFAALRLTSESPAPSVAATATQTASTAAPAAPGSTSPPAPTIPSTSAPASAMTVAAATTPLPQETPGAAAPAAPAPPAVTAVPQPTAAPAPAAGGQSIATPASGDATSGQPAATPVPGQDVPGGAPAIASGQPAATPNPTPQPISLEVRPGVDPGVAQQVQAAYALYWARRAQAFYFLDSGPLDEVAAEKELDGSVQLIQQLRSENRAGETVVRHNAVLLSATEVDAAIFDEYQDASYYIDPVNKQPLSSETNTYSFKDVFQLRKIAGTWKVVGGERYD